MNRRNRLGARPRLEMLEGRLVLSTVMPAQLDSAYGLNAVRFSNGTIPGDGRGQTIAIVDPYNDPTIWTDLWAYDAKNGLANPLLAWNLPAKLNTNGGQPTMTMLNYAGTSPSATNSNWNVEEALDLEMAHATAPAANIVVIEAKTAGLYDLLAAVKVAESLPSVSVVSMSWGGPEFPGLQSFDSTFTTPAGHTGITFLASSGDSGAGDEWPASSPNVVGVGGTTLVESSSGSRVSEAAWGGSGGAVSTIESKPTYQGKAVSGTMRSTPDVALDSDPATGASIVVGGNLAAVGGTSMAAPIWAGLIAIADQGRELVNGTTLDGPSQTLPDLYAAPAGSFYDVTTGPRATLGYDTSTGLGTPNAPTLIAFMDQGTIPTPTKPVPTPPTPASPVSTTSTTKPVRANASLEGAGLAGRPATVAPQAIPPLGSPVVANLVSLGSMAPAQDPVTTDLALGDRDFLGLGVEIRPSAHAARG